MPQNKIQIGKPIIQTPPRFTEKPLLNSDFDVYDQMYLQTNSKAHTQKEQAFRQCGLMLDRSQEQIRVIERVSKDVADLGGILNQMAPNTQDAQKAEKLATEYLEKFKNAFNEKGIDGNYLFGNSQNEPPIKTNLLITDILGNFNQNNTDHKPGQADNNIIAIGDQKFKASMLNPLTNEGLKACFNLCMQLQLFFTTMDQAELDNAKKAFDSANTGLNSSIADIKIQQTELIKLADNCATEGDEYKANVQEILDVNPVVESLEKSQEMMAYLAKINAQTMQRDLQMLTMRRIQSAAGAA
jgi:hypothetical protein